MINIEVKGNGMKKIPLGHQNDLFLFIQKILDGK
jgi:hypothetical protein